MNMLWCTREQEFGERKHIDFDIIEQSFYENIYFEDIDFVVKILLICLKNPETYSDDIKIEKFELSKYNYLIHHN